ncbi:MAG TPA: hypothetical protein VOB72_19625 [Candidatus Dormibacteraeota bacterium]|nr:hypothetical protein [Candidatus Dormibacteraeota bacterium]
MRHRWIAFLAALAGSAVLAVGFALAIDHATAVTAPAPRLATVPTSALTRAGYSLSAPGTPPYCGAAQAATQRGWLPRGTAGCPISPDQAARATSATVRETVLARVSATRPGPVGQGRLIWLVVSQPGLHVMFLCVGVYASPACPPGTQSTTAGRAIVLVDALTGRVLDVVAVTATPAPMPPGGLIVPVPAPVRIQPAPVTPIPAPSPVVTDGASGSAGR